MVWLLFFQAVAFGVLSAIVANRKGRDGFGWLWIGFFFGIFGFVAALVVPDLSPTPKAQGQIGSFNEAEATKLCPRCAESIRAQASICHYCNQPFTPEDIEASMAAARVEHKAARTRQWLQNLPQKDRIKVIDTMAREGAARGILPPFTATFWKLAPEERNNRVRRLKELPDDKLVELVQVAIRQV